MKDTYQRFSSLQIARLANVAFACCVLSHVPSRWPDTPVQINANELVYAEKILMGSLYGSSRPKIDLLNLIEMSQAGKLRLDELLTRT